MTVAAPATPGVAGAVRVRRVPLAGVELRKAVDTGSGRWLLVALAVLAVGADLVSWVFGEPADRGLTQLLLLAQLPLGAILPLLGITLVTSEWSQRTALTTFALVPRRSRIVAAKLTAAVVLALGVFAVSALAAVTGHLVAVLSTNAAGSWGSAAAVGRAGLFQVLGVLVGVGFGLTLLNAPQAIVAFFVLPTLLTAVLSMIRPLRAGSRWLDLLGSTTRLLGDPMPGRAWGQLAVSFTVFGVLPLLVSTVRVRRADLS